MYELIVLDSFNEDLKKLDRSIIKMITKRVRKILANPTFGKPLRGELHGFWSERVDKYRIRYKVEGNRVILWYVKHRGEAY